MVAQTHISQSSLNTGAVRLQLTRKDWRWLVDGQILICGADDRFPATDSPLDALRSWQALSDQELGTVLRRLNGFHSIILINQERVVFAVDRVRSIPLFYAVAEQNLHISDNANVLQCLGGDSNLTATDRLDLVGAAEFASALYLNGSRTLYKHIQQVQAGEWIKSSFPHTLESLTTSDYFRLDYQFNGTDSDAWFNNGLQEATWKAVDNLITVAGDRQIVLPLSGGYDSRLLAMALVERGARKLLAFSYGESEQAREVQFARHVAETLSIEWLYIPDTLTDWKVAWTTKSRWQYELGASNLSSFPLFQDWLAVGKLKRTGRLEHNALFCPGHTGDFVSGSKIPQCIISHKGELTYRRRFSSSPDEAMNQLARLIVDRDFNHSDVHNMRGQIKGRVRESLIGTDDQNQSVNAEFLVRQTQDWNWRQRQAKYIVNSVRVYEDHGYEWWLPLWDNAFIDFWSQVPLSRLTGRRAYISYIKTAYAVVENNKLERLQRQQSGSGSTPSVSQSVPPTSHSLDNAAGSLWVRNRILRNLRAKFPYVIQEAAANMKQRIKKARHRSSVQPYPSQPFSRIYTQNNADESARRRESERLWIKPVDALGGLAVEYLDSLHGEANNAFERDVEQPVPSPLLVQRAPQSGNAVR